MTGIQVKGLSVDIARTSTEIVHDVSFAVAPGEVLGIVGESGCGKTTVALAVLGGTRAGAKITSGEVRVDGRPMLGLGDRELRVRRGKDVAYVPQDPAAALNPCLRIERQLTEMLEVHAPQLDRESVARQIRETLHDVALPSDAGFLHRYPHQLSGGQQQRIAIAMAAILKPQAIVMDEPTTGLDVTTQAHILRTIRGLCQKQQVAVVYVSHDLAVVGKLADRVLVIYAGRTVEFGPIRILGRPVHPYTRGLVGAIPVMSEARALATIPGRLPRPGSDDGRCRFSERCSFRISECDAKEPQLLDVRAQHVVRCVRVSDLRDRPLESGRAKVAGDVRTASEPVLEATDVSAAYGPTTVLHGISMGLGAQECVALVGESGSGKTTFARCIVGLHANWVGRVAYRGEPLPATARKRSGQVRQSLQ